MVNRLILVFALISPEHAGADHLTALHVSHGCSVIPNTLKKLRGTETIDGIYAILTQPVLSTATAA